MRTSFLSSAGNLTWHFHMKYESDHRLFTVKYWRDLGNALNCFRGKKHQCITIFQCCKIPFYCGKCKLQVDSKHSWCMYSLFFLFKVRRRNINSFWDIFALHRVNASFIFAIKMFFYHFNLHLYNPCTTLALCLKVCWLYVAAENDTSLVSTSSYRLSLS